MCNENHVQRSLLSAVFPLLCVFLVPSQQVYSQPVSARVSAIELRDSVEKIDHKTARYAEYAQVIDAHPDAIEKFRAYGVVYSHKQALTKALRLEEQKALRAKKQAMDVLNDLEARTLPALIERLQQLEANSKAQISSPEYQQTKTYVAKELRISKNALITETLELAKMEQAAKQDFLAKQKLQAGVDALNKSIRIRKMAITSYQDYLSKADPNIPQPANANVPAPFLVNGYFKEQLKVAIREQQRKLPALRLSATQAISVSQNAQYSLLAPTLDTLAIRKQQAALMKVILDHQQGAIPPVLERVALYTMPERNILQQSSWSNQYSQRDINQSLDKLIYAITVIEDLVKSSAVEVKQIEQRLMELTRVYQEHLSDYSMILKMDVGLNIITEAVSTFNSVKGGGAGLWIKGLDTMTKATEYAVNWKLGKNKPKFSFPKLSSMIVSSRDKLSGDPLYAAEFGNTGYERLGRDQPVKMAKPASFILQQKKAVVESMFTSKSWEARFESEAKKEIGAALELVKPTENWHHKYFEVKEKLSNASGSNNALDTKSIKDVVNQWWESVTPSTKEQVIRHSKQAAKYLATEGAKVGTQYLLKEGRNQEFVDAAMVELEWYIVRIRLINTYYQQRTNTIILVESLDGRFQSILHELNSVQAEQRQLSENVLGTLADPTIQSAVLNVQFSRAVALEEVSIAGLQLPVTASSRAIHHDILVGQPASLVCHINSQAQAGQSSTSALLDVKTKAQGLDMGLDRDPKTPAHLNFSSDGTDVELLGYEPGFDQHHKVYSRYFPSPHLKKVTLHQGTKEMYSASWEIHNGQQTLIRKIDKPVVLDQTVTLTAFFTEPMQNVVYVDGDALSVQAQRLKAATLSQNGGEPHEPNTVWTALFEPSTLRNTYPDWPFVPLKFTAASADGARLLDLQSYSQANTTASAGGTDTNHYARLAEADFSVPSVNPQRFLAPSVQTNSFEDVARWEKATVPITVYPGMMSQTKLTYPDRLYKGVDLVSPDRRVLQRYYDFPLVSPVYFNHLVNSSESTPHQLNINTANSSSAVTSYSVQTALVDWTDLGSGADSPNDRHRAFTLPKDRKLFAHLNDSADKDLFRIGLLKKGQKLGIALSEVSSQFVGNMRKNVQNTTHGQLLLTLFIEQVQADTGKVSLQPVEGLHRAVWNIKTNSWVGFQDLSTNLNIEKSGSYFLQVSTNYNTAFEYALEASVRN